MENEKLVAFLYLLMRDEVTCGSIALTVAKVLGNPLTRPADKQSFEFTNKHLEDYAREIAQKLK